MNIAEELCFLIARRLVIKRDEGLQTKSENINTQKSIIAGTATMTRDRSSYSEWRKSELVKQFNDHFSIDAVIGKRILDFGCGRGELSLFMAKHEVKSVCGTAVREETLQFAENSTTKEELLVKPSFHLGKHGKIVFPDNSFDLILCFDVLEHITQIKDIMNEWRRVLVKGGKVFIWWQPYFHPYGHHLMSYIPIPWAHVFFSKKTLSVVCKRIFDMQEYVPRLWEQDESGKKIEREFQLTKNFGGVNPLTISKFEKLCKSLGLRIKRRQVYSFSGPLFIEKISKFLTNIPFIREFFTAYMIYELEN